MNPYFFTEPVVTPSMFFGYQEDLKEIVRRVAAPQQERRSYLLVGGKSLGKTSLLRQIERGLKELNAKISNDTNVIPLYLDMFQLCTQNVQDFSTRDVFNKIIDLLDIYFNEKRTSFDFLQTPLDTNAIDPLDAFMRTLKSLMQARIMEQPSARLRIVLLMDDLWRAQNYEKFDTLQRIHLQNIINVLCSNLHALYKEPSLEQCVAYVLNGSYHDFGETHDPGEIESILTYRDLHVLKDKDALSLINEPTQGQMPDPVAKEVYKESGGHPYLTQYFMSKLCEKEDWSALTIEDVAEATESFLEERRDFRRWWQKLSRVDEEVYKAIYHHGPLSRDAIIHMRLNIPVERGDANSRDIIDKSLHALITMGPIRQEDSLYKRAGECHARWFRKNIL